MHSTRTESVNGIVAHAPADARNKVDTARPLGADLITAELERLRARHAQLQLDRLVTLRHYEAQIRELRDPDELVLENYGEGYAWLRPRQ